jgi:hypothetical protein
MGPKGYPACVLFYFAIAVSFLAMGRVALRPGLRANQNFLCRKSMALESHTIRPRRPFTAESDSGAEAAATQLSGVKILAKRPRRTISTAAAFRYPPPAASTSLRASKFFVAHYF